MTLRGRHNGTLDCQDCGDVVRYLSKEEAQMVAHTTHTPSLAFAGHAGGLALKKSTTNEE